MKGVAVCCVRFCQIFLIFLLFSAHDVLQLSSPSRLAFRIKAFKLRSFQNLLFTMNWMKTKVIKYLRKKFSLKLNIKMLAYKPFEIKQAVKFLRVNKTTVWIHHNHRQLSQIVWEWLISRFIFSFPKWQRIRATRIHRRAKYSCYKEGPLKWHHIF